MAKQIALAVLMAALIFILMPAQAKSAASLQAGFRTIGVWTQNPRQRLDLNVWYPCSRQPQVLNYSPWVVNAAQNAKPAEGSFPLLALSHPTPGTRFSYHDLAEFLAANGFFVVAPTHAHDCMNNMDDFFTWNQLATRCREIALAIDLALADPDLRQSINPAQIGVLGFGTGASAALLLGGALPNCDLWPGYCRKAPASDPYCDSRAREKINTICDTFPLKKSLADARIKAVGAVAPAYGMFFNADSFRHFYPRILLVGAGRDNFNLPESHSEAIARILGAKAIYLDLPQADAGALMSECPKSLASELPELCLSVSTQERASIFQSLANTILAFFDQYLRGPDALREVPAPPDLSPPPPEAKPLPAPGPKRQRRSPDARGL